MIKYGIRPIQTDKTQHALKHTGGVLHNVFVANLSRRMRQELSLMARMRIKGTVNHRDMFEVAGIWLVAAEGLKVIRQQAVERMAPSNEELCFWKRHREKSDMPLVDWHLIGEIGGADALYADERDVVFAQGIEIIFGQIRARAIIAQSGFDPIAPLQGHDGS